MITSSTEFFRIDPLTGCNNFLSFVETIEHLPSSEEKHQFSLLYTDMNRLKTLNDSRGHTYGDSVIRWMAIVLREECNAPIYRTGGDEFIAILTSGTRKNFEQILDHVFSRFNKEGEKLDIPTPVARIALVHYDDTSSISLHNVLFQLGEAMMDVKTMRDRTINIYWARDLISADATTESQESNKDENAQFTLRWIANDAISRVQFLGQMLDDAQKTSLIDSISDLPNMRAAHLKMDLALNRSTSSESTFSILLMDGDNLTRYNDISYAAGDEMIQRISSVLSENLRPGDFLARWRTGDEFIAVLPNTSSQGAMAVGERFCSAIRDASRTWQFQTSISIGVATFPKDGKDINTLVETAEGTLKQAKEMGKNRVILPG